MQDDNVSTLDSYRRIYKCANNLCNGCGCCQYCKTASDMLFDMMIRDMNNYMRNTNSELTSWDCKKIILGVYNRIIELEKGENETKSDNKE